MPGKKTNILLTINAWVLRDFILNNARMTALFLSVFLSLAFGLRFFISLEAFPCREAQSAADWGNYEILETVG